MSSNTKIVVLRSKELVYALVLLVVSVLIIMVAVSLFIPSKDSTDEKSAQPSPEVSSEVSSEASQGVSSETPVDVNAGAGAIYTTDTYVPGIYSSTLQLGSSTVELQITVDKNHINSINMTNIDESITTLYPLMRPTLSELSAVILAEQSIDNISYNDENRYTSMLLMQAITQTLDKAVVSENEDKPESGIIY
ncbi:MAG: hypothetical protein K1W36_13740 [Lachnospiraceae bacterium]|mgnify:FL=1|jgi:uncharacterized protein with FMN-binding domain|nr:hypothetical protein [Lachnospiraceae bacterium]